jgi:hypothetical protein
MRRLAWHFAWALAIPALAAAAELDPKFLELPAHDLELQGGAAAQVVVVGDTLRFKLGGLDSKGFKAQPAPGDEALANQGFRAEIQPDGLLAVIPLKAGRITLPSLAIAPEGGAAVARTNPWPLEVQSAIAPDDPKPEEPVDLRPPVDLPFPWRAAIAAGLGVLAFLGLAAFLWKKYGRRAKKVVKVPAVVGPPKPLRPEDEEAHIALAELERAGPLKGGGFKAHYFRLSDILKHYCGRRWDFDATESTTAELLARIAADSALAEAQKQRLRSLFERLDRVKFTDFKPLPDEAFSLIGEARDFVTLSRRPKPAPSSGDTAGRAPA